MRLIPIACTRQQVYNHKGCSAATLLSDVCHLFIRKFKYL